MTRTFKVTGSELVEQARMEKPTFNYGFPPDGPSDSMLHSAELDYEACMNSYNAHLTSLTRYTINPSDWTGIQEVKEGEFEVRKEIRLANGWHPCSDRYYEASHPEGRRLFAIPKRKEQGREEMIWVAYHNDCIHESAAYPISIHRSKEGAEKAMLWHKEEAYKKWNEINEYHKENNNGEEWGVTFGLHQAWFVQESKLLP